MAKTATLKKNSKKADPDLDKIIETDKVETTMGDMDMVVEAAREILKYESCLEGHEIDTIEYFSLSLYQHADTAGVFKTTINTVTRKEVRKLGQMILDLAEKFEHIG
jgi:hypothetical protein